MDGLSVHKVMSREYPGRPKEAKTTLPHGLKPFTYNDKDEFVPVHNMWIIRSNDEKMYDERDPLRRTLHRESGARSQEPETASLYIYHSLVGFYMEIRGSGDS